MFRIREKAYRLMRNPIPGMNGLNAAPSDRRSSGGPVISSGPVPMRTLQ
jgi:hypothetical protein